jgi:hypothetical protein
MDRSEGKRTEGGNVKLPQKRPPMRARLMGDGAKGFFMHLYGNDLYSIQLLVEGNVGQNNTTELWSHLDFPDVSFDSYEKMRAFLQDKL